MRGKNKNNANFADETAKGCPSDSAYIGHVLPLCC